MQAQLNAPDLAALYMQFDIPVDALATMPERLEAFTVAVNAMGHSWTPQELLKALLTARKKGLLPRLRRGK